MVDFYHIDLNSQKWTSYLQTYAPHAIMTNLTDFYFYLKTSGFKGKLFDYIGQAYVLGNYNDFVTLCNDSALNSPTDVMWAVGQSMSYDHPELVKYTFEFTEKFVKDWDDVREPMTMIIDAVFSLHFVKSLLVLVRIPDIREEIWLRISEYKVPNIDPHDYQLAINIYKEPNDRLIQVLRGCRPLTKFYLVLEVFYGNPNNVITHPWKKVLYYDYLELGLTEASECFSNEERAQWDAEKRTES